MFHQRYWVILSLKYLVLDVNISIQSDRSLVLSQAEKIFQWIKPGGPPSFKYTVACLTGQSWRLLKSWDTEWDPEQGF